MNETSAGSESMEFDSTSISAGRHKISWDELSEKSHENKLTSFWTSFVIPLLKETQEKILNQGIKKGIPVKTFSFFIELATTTNEKRKEKLYFPESEKSAQEKLCLIENWKVTKSIAYACNSFKLSSRARDALLSASGSQIKGYEVKEMLRQIDTGMTNILPIQQPDLG